MTVSGRTIDGRILIGTVAGVVALVLGIGLVMFGPAAAAAGPGLVASVAILSRPILGLAALLVPVPFEDALVLGEIGTITKLIGAAVAGLWFARKVLRADSWRDIVTVPLIILGILFITVAGTSFIWAEYPQGFRTEILRLVMALALALLIIDIVHTWQHLRWLIRTLLIGGLVAAALVLSQYYGVGGVSRAGDTVAGGVNATAFVLVTLLPFGFLAMRSGKGVTWKLLGLVYVCVALPAVVVTFSRMSFLLVPVVLLVEGWETFRHGRGRVPLAITAVVVVLVAIRFVPLEPVKERIATIGPYIEQTLAITEDTRQPQSTLSGRGYHLYVAYRMFQDHPVLGVGYGNYGPQFLQYQLRVPGSNLLYRSERSPHSSFAGILAELGLVGIILWLTLLGSCFYGLVRAWKRTRYDRKSQAFLTVRAVMMSFVLVFAYGFYAEMQNEKIFWIVLAFTVVVDRLTRGYSERRVPEEPRDVAVRRPTGRVGAGSDSLPVAR